MMFPLFFNFLKSGGLLCGLSTYSYSKAFDENVIKEGVKFFIFRAAKITRIRFESLELTHEGNEWITKRKFLRVHCIEKVRWLWGQLSHLPLTSNLLEIT